MVGHSPSLVYQIVDKYAKGTLNHPCRRSFKTRQTGPERTASKYLHGIYMR